MSTVNFSLATSFSSTSEVIVIAGDTGSGKSTQSAIEAWLFSSNNFDNEVIFWSAQPRKINTVMLSSYCNLLAEEEGIFSYLNGDESNITSKTKGIFCTYGILLSKLKDLTFNPSFIALDELHEFSIEQELSLALITKRIKEGTLTSKILLVSATLSNNEIDTYLQSFKVDKLHLGGVKYPIEEHVLTTNKQICEAVEKHLLNNERILVFLSGKGEIKQFREMLGSYVEYTEESKLKDFNFNILEAHSQVEALNEKLHSHIGLPTLILSTDICEAGITPPALDVVVNMATKKQIQVSELGVNALVEVFTSVAEDMQRKGRVGRTHPGTYYLFSDGKDNDKPLYPTPAIKREELSKVQLICRSINLSANDLQFVHQPDIRKISLADELLINLGCLNNDLSITEIGSKVVKLPMSVRLGRAFVEAEKLECVNELIGFIAVLEVGSPWKIHEPIQRLTNKSDVLNILLALYNLDPNYKDSWIFKLGNSIKHNIQKLTERLGSTTLPHYEEKYDAVLKCLLHSFDQFRCLGSSRHGQQVYNDKLGKFSIERASIIEPTQGDFVIGIPREIKPKSGARPFTVLTMVSKVPVQE